MARAAAPRDDGRLPENREMMRTGLIEKTHLALFSSGKVGAGNRRNSIPLYCAIAAKR